MLKYSHRFYIVTIISSSGDRFYMERIIQVQSFFYTEPISLNKAHSMKWKAFDNKTLHLYNHSLFIYIY